MKPKPFATISELINTIHNYGKLSDTKTTPGKRPIVFSKEKWDEYLPKNANVKVRCSDCPPKDIRAGRCEDCDGGKV